MNRRQKSWITRMENLLRGMDRQERTMEISARALKLYSNTSWPTWEIREAQEFLLKEGRKNDKIHNNGKNRQNNFGICKF